MKLYCRFLLRFGLVVLVLVVLSLGLILAVDGWVAFVGRAKVVSIEDAQVSDCVIVPGAAVYSNGRPSLMLQDRLDVALDFYNTEKTDRILVSGDNGQPEYNEVKVMRDYLLAHGVPAEHIFMDHAGFDTYDTMYRARDVFLVQRAVVVTQEFHLLRALYIGSRLGLSVEGVTSDQRIYARADYYRLREYLARLKAFAECELFHPLPKYLGETIPISGDGRLTAGS